MKFFFSLFFFFRSRGFILEFFYEDECRDEIASMRIEGRINEANEMERTRQRVISSVGMDLVDDDE